MRTVLLILLCLTVITPVAHSADWLSWRKVGDATLTWGPFTVYTSQLLTPDGRYNGPEQDQALIITYKRNIDRDELVEATRDQWQAQGVLAREPQSEPWLRMLHSLWPDVTPGAQLAFVFNGKQGQFWYRASASQKVLPRSVRASLQPSVHVFWPSGSILARNIPNCVSS